MSTSNIVPGGCTQPAIGPGTDAASSGGIAPVLPVLGGLVQAAMGGNLGAALKAMLKAKAIDFAKQAATALLMRLFTQPPDPKPPKPRWPAVGKVAAPGSAVAMAALAAWNSAHAAPAVGGASAPAGGGAGTAGSGSGGASGSGAGSSGTGSSQMPAPQPFTLEDIWVDISFSDIIHTAVGLAMMPAAIVLRSIAALFPETMKSLFALLPTTGAGTGDKTGLGILVGNNDGKDNDVPGVVGIAFSLAHQLFKSLGLDGIFNREEFEKGMDDHDRKTGVDLNTGELIKDSDDLSSAGQALGQLLGILARKVGLGDLFYRLIKSVMGLPDGYGFVTGVMQGTHQSRV